MAQADIDQIVTEYKRTFGTADGQAVLRDIARYCGVGLPITVQSDPTMVYGMECMRRVFWYIYHQVHTVKRPTDRSKTAPALDFDIFTATTPHLRPKE